MVKYKGLFTFTGRLARMRHIGTVLLAGTEVISLLKGSKYEQNDSAVQFSSKDP